MFDTEIQSLAVSPLRFLRETEEAEKDNRARRYHPSSQLHGHGTLMIALPKNQGVKVDSGIVEMCVGPADPRLDGTACNGQIHAVCTDRDGNEEIGRGQGHETEVSVESEGRMTSQDLVELGPPTNECSESQDWLIADWSKESVFDHICCGRAVNERTAVDPRD